MVISCYPASQLSHCNAFIFFVRFQGSFHMTICTWSGEGTLAYLPRKERNSIKTIKLKPVTASTCHRNNIIIIISSVFYNLCTCMLTSPVCMMLSIQIYTVYSKTVCLSLAGVEHLASVVFVNLTV